MNCRSLQLSLIMELTVMMSLPSLGADVPVQLRGSSPLKTSQTLEKAIQDVKEYTADLFQLISDGKSKTSNLLRTKFTDLQITLTELESLHLKLKRSDISSKEFAPYADLAVRLGQISADFDDLGYQLIKNKSSEDKRIKLLILGNSLDGLLVTMSQADSHYKDRLYEYINQIPSSSPKSCKSKGYKFYALRWLLTSDVDQKAVALEKLARGVNSFDEFITRFMGKTYDGFFPMKKFENSGPDQLHQGWKLHVSAKVENAHIVAAAVLPILARLEVPHKIVSSEAQLSLLAKTPTQAGKFITIYPKDDKQAVEIASVLDRVIKGTGLGKSDFDHPPSDLLIGQSGAIFTRYGAYHGLKIHVVDENGHIQLDDEENPVQIDDSRDEGYKPSFMTWDHPFSVLSPLLRRKNATHTIGFNPIAIDKSTLATSSSSPQEKKRGHKRETFEEKIGLSEIAQVLKLMQDQEAE